MTLCNEINIVIGNRAVVVFIDKIPSTVIVKYVGVQSYIVSMSVCAPRRLTICVRVYVEIVYLCKCAFDVDQD